MPYLTSTGTARRTSGADRLGFGVPGYAHPLLAPAEWAELTRPGTPLHWAVLNIDNGPGSRPDPHCLEAAGRLRNARARALGDGEPVDTVRAAGGRLLGQLDLAQGARPFGELLADARSFLDWYRVDGFYLDRCPADRAGLPGVRRLTGTLRAFLGRDGGHLVLGHDTHPYPGYAETGDQLVTFRGAWSDYRWSQVAEWTADYPPGRFAHFVHGVPRTHLEEAMRIARWQGAGTIFFTDRGGRSGPENGRGQSDPFAALPRYWDEIVSRIGPGISE
ncbi:spherulation-specific family 4 protein [Streptomyces sp. KhCrAH-43]|uniref:spherulation-specific family 4 protein n=1 Tax=Streptomyces TaxID=1883 RepID=UPI00036F90AF|nr:spherulation-specific family 4 protein [Streptomyces sp. KhCrAH-43]MYS38120.1 phage tail protein [Streptomyces sp. SID4920]MYX66307.1 phage tail protein [Streptomyces sp. SID8373]RAJ67793.1 spherulation-specific family 4 protein [Streptomyces sp. KhCrAH-43]